MNRLSIEKRAQIIGLLVEGMSMGAVTRITGMSINTVIKLLEDVGIACNFYQAQTLVNLPCRNVQCDEIWAFCGKEQKNVRGAELDVLGAGDVWTWTAICADTKLMVTYALGKRDVTYAAPFIMDLASRLVNRIQLSTDGHHAYVRAVEAGFAGEVDYGMLKKVYGAAPDGQRRFSPAEFVAAEKRVMVGNPDEAKISTSYVERQNLTMRMEMRRFIRLTNGFSTKVENLEHAVSQHFMHYNFARIHKTLRVTPAMAAGVSDHVWSLEEIAQLSA